MRERHPLHMLQTESLRSCWAITALCSDRTRRNRSSKQSAHFSQSYTASTAPDTHTCISQHLASPQRQRRWCEDKMEHMNVHLPQTSEYFRQHLVPKLRRNMEVLVTSRVTLMDSAWLEQQRRGVVQPCAKLVVPPHTFPQRGVQASKCQFLLH